MKRKKIKIAKTELFVYDAQAINKAANRISDPTTNTVTYTATGFIR